VDIWRNVYADCCREHTASCVSDPRFDRTTLIAFRHSFASSLLEILADFEISRLDTAISTAIILPRLALPEGR